MFKKVSVEFFGDSFVIRRSGMPKESVSGKAHVGIFLDEKGRITAIQIDFIEYYHVNKEKRRDMLKSAKW